MSPPPTIEPAARTLFDTPVLTPLLRTIARALSRLLGWRMEGVIPANLHQAVVIGAPHTSNWDFPFMLMAVLVLERKLHWLGKAQIFRFPFAGLMRWLGGIPVDRSRSNNLVDAAVRCFSDRQQPLLLLISPEGTRSEVKHWKTGFYHIALGAKVPVVMGYFDYSTRTFGASRLFHPTGDVDADMIAIRAFYTPFRGWTRRDERG